MAETNYFGRINALSRLFDRRPMTSQPKPAIDYSGDSDESIIAHLLKTHDPSAFTIIVTRYRDKLTALARTTLAGSAVYNEADDLVQDAFVSAYDNLTTFRLDSTFRPWIYRILINRCTDRLRVSRRLVATDDFDFYADKTPGPLETTVVNDQIRRIGDAVAMLPAHLRVIFLLRHMENLSYADLCKVTGLPEGTVKTHLFRARARIREIVQEEAV